MMPPARNWSNQGAGPPARHCGTSENETGLPLSVYAADGNRPASILDKAPPRYSSMNPGGHTAPTSSRTKGQGSPGKTRGQPGSTQTSSLPDPDPSFPETQGELHHPAAHHVDRSADHQGTRRQDQQLHQNPHRQDPRQIGLNRRDDSPQNPIHQSTSPRTVRPA